MFNFVFIDFFLVPILSVRLHILIITSTELNLYEQWLQSFLFFSSKICSKIRKHRKVRVKKKTGLFLDYVKLIHQVPIMSNFYAQEEVSILSEMNSLWSFVILISFLKSFFFFFFFTWIIWRIILTTLRFALIFVYELWFKFQIFIFPILTLC